MTLTFSHVSSFLLSDVIGLPIALLLLLHRNRGNLNSHVTKVRYGLFYSTYSDNRFYWEIILLARKISIVALGLFGPILGTLQQAEMSLLVILACILLEIKGAPYRKSSPRHSMLPKLEISCLCTEWITMWSGIMIFSSMESRNHETPTILLSGIIILTNITMMGWLSWTFVCEYFIEHKEKIGKVAERASLVLPAFFNISSIGKDGDDAGSSVVEMQEWHGENTLFMIEALKEAASEGAKKKRNSKINTRECVDI